VWWCCVRLCFCVLFILVLVDCLQGIMRMGIPIRWSDESCRHAIMGHGSSTTHKDACDIDLAGWCIQGCGTLVTCLEVWHFAG
jgi:hypothetical protein